MKVYKFIFFVGFLNLVVPFLGIRFVYKNFFLVGLAIITIAYALILRAVEKEKENQRLQSRQRASREAVENVTTKQSKTIEEVVDMVEESAVEETKTIPKKKGRKPRIIAQEKIYE